MELLYNVMDCPKNIFRQMLQLRQPVKADIHRVVEENYTSPISLDELAYPLAARCRVSSESFRTSTENRQHAGYARSDCRKPMRCYARQTFLLPM